MFNSILSWLRGDDVAAAEMAEMSRENNLRWALSGEARIAQLEAALAAVERQRENNLRWALAAEAKLEDSNA